MEKVTETKIYERFRVGGQIPICGPVFLENRLGLDGWRKSCVHKNLGLRSIMIKI